MYCMRTSLEELVNDWLCEECSKPPSSCLLEEVIDVSKVNSPEVCNDGELHTESRKLPNELKIGALGWEKVVATGKTKYISVTEAIKLSSGEKQTFSSPSHQERRKCRMGKFDAPTRRRSVLLDDSSQQNIASGPYQPRKPPRPGNTEIHKKQLQQSKKLTEFRSQSSRRPSESLKNLVKEQPSKVRLPAKGRSTKLSSVSSADTSPVAISGGDGHNNANDLSAHGAENLSKINLLDSEKCLLVPALDALWKGRFRIQDNHVQKEINHLIQAHPPSRVRKPIYDFSKQMPEVLQFEFVPSRPFWNKLFIECAPDERDIALYFFPGVGERSEDDNIFLVDYLISSKNALRERIADFELLVFSSKLLPDNCQCWEGKYFLWGVFHRVKLDATTCPENRILELTVQPSHDMNLDQSRMHEDKEVDMDIDMIGGISMGRIDIPVEVDMDIDMIGGINMGRIDIPVQKEPPKVKCAEEEPRVAVALPESTLVASSITPTTKIPAPNIKIETCDLIPPGFEEVHRLRIQSSFSSTMSGRDVNKGRNKW